MTRRLTKLWKVPCQNILGFPVFEVGNGKRFSKKLVREWLVIGWGETTIIRYVKGLTPTKEYSKTLKKLMNPQYMFELYLNNKETLTDVSQRKLYTRLMVLLDQGPTSLRGNKLISISEYFLNKIDLEAGESITPLKLQKLVYYAQAWSLAFNSSFIQEDFQAWVHGPVIPSLYVHYREFGSANLPKVYSFDASVFEQEELNILDLVWSVYGKYDAKYLERLTHAERPWVNARQGLDHKERCNNIISKQETQDYYSGLREIHGTTGEYSLKGMRNYQWSERLKKGAATN